jgi:hypothetical protein
MTGEAKADRRKSPEFREECRARAQAQWTPAARTAQSALAREKLKSPVVRQRISERTKTALADPDVHQRHVNGLRTAMARADVRERISVGTKTGIARWRERQLVMLRDAWRKAGKQARLAFLAEIAAAVAKVSS